MAQLLMALVSLALLVAFYKGNKAIFNMDEGGCITGFLLIMFSAIVFAIGMGAAQAIGV